MMDKARDVRLDLLRGLVLLVILVDHIESMARVKMVSAWTLAGTGYADGADALIFISGFVFGLAYCRRLSRESLGRCTVHACIRAAQIVGTYVVAAFCVIAMGFAMGPHSEHLAHESQIDRRSLLSLIFRIVTLQYRPCGFEILLCYAILLPVMPAWLWLWRRKALVAGLLSLAVYGAAQWIGVHHVDLWLVGRRAKFNPLGWQLLFCIAAALGARLIERQPEVATETREGRGRGATPLGRWLILGAAAVVLVGVFGARKLALPSFDWMHAWATTQPPWGARATWQPVRAIHFGCLAVVLVALIPSRAAIERQRWLKPLLSYSRRPLTAYGSGLVLTHASILAFDRHGNHLWLVLLTEASVILASFLIVFLASRVSAYRARAAGVPS